jgi:glutathione S-transferase
MTVTLYYMPESPPCRAVQMLAAHINLPLDLKYINLDTGEQKSAEFTAVNPHQVVPTIVDEGFVLWESRAILKYLVDKFAPNSPLYPKDLKQRAKIDQVLDFDIGTLYNSLGKFLVPLLFGRPTDAEGEQKFRNNLPLLENMLVHGYVCGPELTIADFSIVAGLSFADTVLFDFSPWPRISEWKVKLRQEIRNYAEINDETMKGFIEYMKDKMSQLPKDK